MNLLKELIKITGLSQTQFANKVGCNQSHINRNLANGGDMKFSTFKKYAEICSVKTLEINSAGCKVKILFKTQTNH